MFFKTHHISGWSPPKKNTAPHEGHNCIFAGGSTWKYVYIGWLRYTSDSEGAVESIDIIQWCMFLFIFMYFYWNLYIYIYIYRGPCFFENKMPQFGYKSEKIGRMRKGHFSNFKGGGLCRRTGSETEGLFVKSAQKQKAIPWEWYIYLYLVRFLWQM